MTSFSCFIENKGVAWLVYLIKEVFMSEWICVKERTPTSNESVMVGSFDDYGNNGIAKAWFTNGNWYLDCDGLRATDDHCIYLDTTVTHWQPLYQPTTQQIKE